MPIPKPPVINYYKIRAYNKIGKSNFSVIINSEGGSGAGILGPQSLTATAWGQREVELNWVNRATNGIYLSVQRKSASSVLWSPIATLSASRTSYTDNSGTLFGGATYYYRVKVIAQTDSGSSREVSVITWPFDLTPASNLIGVFADTPAVSKRMVKLSWKDNSNQEEGNLIERKEGSGGTYQTIAILSSDITAFDDTLITKGKTYFYRIKLSKQGYISRPSNEVSVTITEPAKAIIRYERKRK
ncbi:MAG: fibronectin type III domain-containing protein [Ignavibacteriales bacterium]|nr:fibronectin type III domain-containing protein [Ignavibacteriales bacterium]